MPTSAPQTPITARLRAALSQALSSRDAVAVAVIRSALGAISNAEAVPPPAGARATASSEHVAGAVAGLGAAEAERRQLTEAEVAVIVAAEIADRRAAADHYVRLRRGDQAERLRREADVLTGLLDER
jgi:uncharacterized protein